MYNQNKNVINNEIVQNLGKITGQLNEKNVHPVKNN